MYRTLIVALDLGDPEDQDACLFYAEHLEKDLDIRQALKTAFEDWAATPQGAHYIEQNGDNWGDATCIPKRHLRTHRIGEYAPAVTTGAAASMGRFVRKLVETGFDRRLVVDHNEKLVDNSLPPTESEEG